MKLTCYGAAREVTGSRHMLEVRGKRILLDCGMFQGHRQEAEAKNRQLPFDAKNIHAVVLSHAHLDHCGSLPTLYKAGYRGPIYATPATKDVARLIMLDSAHVQMSDNRHVAFLKGFPKPEEPAYTSDDVEGVMRQFVNMPYHREFAVTPQVKGFFRDAGHILGSATVELTIKDRLGRQHKLGFTGDLGRTHMPILRDPEFFSDIDMLITESTYGDRLHDSFDQAKRILKKFILIAVKRKARIIVPSFALGRTQELIYVLHQLTDEKKIPRIPIYVDSPLAIDITDEFKRHEECYDRETGEIFAKDDNPFGFRNLTYTHTTEESMQLNHLRGPVMIIAAAGMCEAGRIRHHLKNSVENPNNMVMITGFMAKHTLGRKIVDGDKMIKIFDNMYHLRAQVVVLNAFSAHADAVDLVNFAEQAGQKLKRIFVVHGEETQSLALRGKLEEVQKNYRVTVPVEGQAMNI